MAGVVPLVGEDVVEVAGVAAFGADDEGAAGVGFVRDGEIPGAGCGVGDGEGSGGDNALGVGIDAAHGGYLIGVMVDWNVDERELILFVGGGVFEIVVDVDREGLVEWVGL